jgi:hypothetical protein
MAFNQNEEERQIYNLMSPLSRPMKLPECCYGGVEGGIVADCAEGQAVVISLAITCLAV